jgi:hypothetical protein
MNQLGINGDFSPNITSTVSRFSMFLSSHWDRWSPSPGIPKWSQMRSSPVLAGFSWDVLALAVAWRWMGNDGLGCWAFFMWHVYFYIICNCIIYIRIYIYTYVIVCMYVCACVYIYIYTYTLQLFPVKSLQEQFFLTIVINGSTPEAIRYSAVFRSNNSFFCRHNCSVQPQPYHRVNWCELQLYHVISPSYHR